MAITTVYVVIKVNVEHPDTMDADEATSQAIDEMSYDLSYNENGIQIVDTLLLGKENDCPID